MRIKTENLKYVLIIGIPIISIACMGACAEFVGWEWLENKSEDWIREIKQ